MAQVWQRDRVVHKRTKQSWQMRWAGQAWHTAHWLGTASSAHAALSATLARRRSHDEFPLLLVPCMMFLQSASSHV